VLSLNCTAMTHHTITCEHLSWHRWPATTCLLALYPSTALWPSSRWSKFLCASPPPLSSPCRLLQQNGCLPRYLVSLSLFLLSVCPQFTKTALSAQAAARSGGYGLARGLPLLGGLVGGTLDATVCRRVAGTAAGLFRSLAADSGGEERLLHKADRQDSARKSGGGESTHSQTTLVREITHEIANVSSALPHSPVAIVRTAAQTLADLRGDSKK
jgi:hypothetical protein